MQTREATIIIDIPIVKKEKGKIHMTFDVKGMIQIIESQICSLMSTSQKLAKPIEGKTRYEESLFLLHELKKFYLADSAGVKTLPEEIK